mmetsp:Transcript_26431/g.56734  ORF Transcript_26431/g.56734 Transcript_26431/m.56734 type:complete len:284 (-) Transcript_26431:945-1796(-)
MFTRFTDAADNHRIGLSQSLHTFNQLRKIGRILRFDSATDNRGHRKLHGLDTVGIIGSSDGSRLQQVLINTNQGTSVSGRDVGNLFGIFTHHDHSTLDILDPKFSLLSGDVVRTHNSDLLSSGNLSREDTSEGVETTLVRCRNHLRDVHAHRSTLGCIASTNGSGSLIVQRTVVKAVHTVRLGLHRGRKVKHNHLQNGITSRKPLLHDTLQQLFSGVFLLLSLEFDTNSLQHLLHLSMFLSHDSFEKGGDRGGDECAESTFERSPLITGGPDRATGIEVPITP